MQVSVSPQKISADWICCYMWIDVSAIEDRVLLSTANVSSTADCLIDLCLFLQMILLEHSITFLYLQSVLRSLKGFGRHAV